ncbi:MAG: HAMP domain-containing histidine kinase [Alphaproteobacteria bacterium]|nr:HAMP domain-containing histidine kinase [Alphaproteobacteria bacterium]
MMSNPQPAPLFSASLLLARNGIYGLAWLDAQLIVTGRFGELASRLEIGEPMHAGMPILADYEDDIHALPSDGVTSFELPGILLVASPDEARPRIDISVFRHASETPDRSTDPAGMSGEADQATGAFLLLITRASHQSTTDVAVARLQRDRRMLLEQIEQQKLELEKANAELELCNRDLEDYASIISHDLKAPMRILRYLADDVEQGVEEANPEKIHEACTALKGQSRRMSTMLSQLLDYASLGRNKDALEVIDSRQLIGDIVASLPCPDGFAIKIQGDWPELTTYIAPLDLVLRNLIDNAIKHHDLKSDGWIEITGTQQGEHLNITVADNGPGIPLGRQDAVFFPFRSYRLDGDGQYLPNDDLSHGMGLAFVKRTVESVGGKLTLASDPGTARGSQFSISWPTHQPPGAAN